MVGRARLTALAARLDGGVAGPDSVRRRTVRALHEVQPHAVVRCASPRDVATAVRFARDEDVPFAIRAGGHSFADHCTSPGLVLDVRALDHVTLDADGAHVTIGPGVLIGGLADRLAQDGLLVPSGWCPSVGAVGAALGGGYGPFGRRHGLASDHVVAADIVLADGTTVRVDADHRPDLLWALRGAGGGQFGVVTALRLRTRRAEPATTFTLTWAHEHAVDVVDAWQHWAPASPASVNAELIVAASATQGTVPIAATFGLIAQPPDKADAVVDEFARAVGSPPWRRWVRPLPASAAARNHDYAGFQADATPMTGPPDGMGPGRRVLRSHFVRSMLPRSVIADLVAAIADDRVTGEYREAEFVPWGGALAAVAPEATAFAHRDPRFLVEVNGDVPAGSTEDARRAIAERITRAWRHVQPHATGHAYPNYPDPDLPDWPAASLGANLARAIEVKTEYDPDDVFRHAQSVRPLS